MRLFIIGMFLRFAAIVHCLFPPRPQSAFVQSTRNVSEFRFFDGSKDRVVDVIKLREAIIKSPILSSPRLAKSGRRGDFGAVCKWIVEIRRVMQIKEYSDDDGGLTDNETIDIFMRFYNLHISPLANNRK